jgi:hypothetical protein
LHGIFLPLSLPSPPPPPPPFLYTHTHTHIHTHLKEKRRCVLAAVGVAAGRRWKFVGSHSDRVCDRFLTVLLLYSALSISQRQRRRRRNIFRPSDRNQQQQSRSIRTSTATTAGIGFSHVQFLCLFVCCCHRFTYSTVHLL